MSTATVNDVVSERQPAVGSVSFDAGTANAPEIALIAAEGLSITSGASGAGYLFAPYAAVHVKASAEFDATWTSSGAAGPAAVVFIEHGKLEVAESDTQQERAFGDGEFVFLAPRDLTVQLSCTEPTELLWFSFQSPEALERVAAEHRVNSLHDAELKSPVLRGAHAALSEIANETDVVPPHELASLRSFTRDIARTVVSEIFSSLTEDLLESARGVVLRRATDVGFDVPALADALGTSRRTIERAGAAEGWYPAREIRAVRAKRARLLLTEQPNLSLAAVAAASGFGSVDSMRRTLQRAFGLKPNEVRGRD